MVNADYKSHYSKGDPSEGIPERVEFLICPGCWGPFVTTQEDYGGGQYSDPEILYPPPSRVNPNLPTAIKAAFTEADACFRGRAFTAAAIMCRKTIEGLCAEHGIKGKPLVQALKLLKEQGVIESRLFEWADMLRMSGNEAAHDVSVTVSPDDARDLVEFTSAILEYVFTFRDKFEAFKKRRPGIVAKDGV